MDCVIVYVAFLHVFFFLYLVPIFVIFLTPRGQAVMTCYLGLLKGCRIKE